jgi:hypothetical protein
MSKDTDDTNSLLVPLVLAAKLVVSSSYEWAPLLMTTKYCTYVAKNGIAILDALTRTHTLATVNRISQERATRVMGDG